MNKVKLRYGEDTYTLCVTPDDWWVEECVDMPERMIATANEVALENGMIPPGDLCANCQVGSYKDIIQDYRLGEATIKDLPLRKCEKCGHIVLPPNSVAQVDLLLERRSQ